MSKKLKRSEKLRSDDVGIPLVSTIAEVGAVKVMGWPANAVSVDMEGDRASLSYDIYLSDVAIAIRDVVASSKKEGASDPYSWVDQVSCLAVELEKGKPLPICLVIVGDGKGSARSTRLRHEAIQQEIADAIAAAEAGVLSDEREWTPLQVRIHRKLMTRRKAKDSRMVEFYLPDQTSRAKGVYLDKCTRLKVFLPVKPSAKKQSGSVACEMNIGDLDISGSNVTLLPSSYDSPNLPLGGVVVPIAGEDQKKLIAFAKTAGVAVFAEARYLKDASGNQGRVKSFDFSNLEGIRMEVLRKENGTFYVCTTMPKRLRVPKEAANDQPNDDQSGR